MDINNINIEELMYNLIERIAQLGHPIVFKGHMVLKHLIMSESINIGTYRGTRDIDMDWCDSLENKVAIENELDSLIQSYNTDSLRLLKTRDFTETNSGGFTVAYNGNKLFSVDISLRLNPFVELYVTNNGVKFVGSSRYKMLADKIRAISTKVVYRRVKDIYDLYLLSHLKGLKYNSIQHIIEYEYEYNKRGIGEFVQFTDNLKEITHAYNELKGIVNKPDFKLVYGVVRDFVYPFMLKMGTCQIDKTWNIKSRSWV